MTLPTWTPEAITALRERTDLSQAEFAARYFLPIRAYIAWEQGRAEPDPAACVLLHLIEFNPEQAASVLQYLAEKNAQ